MIQRALVLQGGGALGAYELGVYRALCERLIEKDNLMVLERIDPCLILLLVLQ